MQSGIAWRSYSAQSTATGHSLATLWYWAVVCPWQQRSSDPLAAGMAGRWQPGSRTRFINVTAVATAAQRLGQQCGGSRDHHATVLWQQVMQQQLGTGLAAQRRTAAAAQEPAGSRRSIPPVPQRWPRWQL